MTPDEPAVDPLDPREAGPDRVHAALFRIQGRYATTAAGRARLANPHMLGPSEAVRLVTYLAGGAIPYLDDAEPQVQAADLVAALNLLPLVRAEVDDLEIGLLTMARGEGLTWAQIAAVLCMGSAQAAQQRHDRLTSRARRAELAHG